ncbi:hypothetical protein ST47_g4500 [Ascochyta rabiei]|uniref:Uncharacterized protein n=1 Tax=Didymella rabiei TaxID=5454 RepID=A0A163FGY9_DIDRA|nr:hypothetical protein ST47_g4500 [Ascochyta rabiei]
MSYVRSAFLKNITSGTKTLALDYVDKTTTWTRPGGFPSTQVKDDFSKAVEQNIHKLNPRTVKVAMKESAHQSEADKRMHYTAFELDAQNNVIATTHLVQTK